MSSYVILGKNGIPIAAQRFECAQNLWHEHYHEARHRLQRLVSAKVVKLAHATICKVDSDVLAPRYWLDDV